MKLSFILSQLKNSEVSTLSSSFFTDEKLLSMLNSALIDLYTIFKIETREAIITLDTVNIKTIYSFDGTDPNVKSEGQLLQAGSFMSFVESHNEDGSVSLFNDEGDPFSLFTPEWNKVEVTLLDGRKYVSVIYKTNPTMYSTNDITTDPEVDIPLFFLEPISLFIGWKVYNAINAKQNMDNNTYYMRYRASIDNITNRGLLVPDENYTINVQNKGYL